MKTVEIYWPLYKRGDDVGCECNEEGTNVVECFERYAELLAASQLVVSEIIAFVKNHGDVEMVLEADTHFVSLTGPEEVMDAMLENDWAAELVFEDSDADDDEDEDEDEDEECCDDDKCGCDVTDEKCPCSEG